LKPLPGSPHNIVAALRQAGLEGVVAKRTCSIYRPGQRSSDWQKFKILQSQEFLIGGYRPDPSTGLDALAVGYYADEQLIFAATVRAGFTPLVRRELLQRLSSLHTYGCPFANLPTQPNSRLSGGVRPDQMNTFHWTRPQLVAQIRFQNWTLEGFLRQPSYSALRFDKHPRTIQRETPR
jgi:bifunctional non-homologous end joining protein LigD